MPYYLVVNKVKKYTIRDNVLYLKMLVLPTKRRVLRRLHSLRWANTGFWANNLTRFNNGIPKEEFLNIVFAEEFSHKNKLAQILKRLHGKIRGNYLQKFNPTIKDIIKRCEENGYIESLGREANLTITDKGRDFISHIYYPKEFLSNSYVKAIIIGIIGVFTTWYITENIINKISNFLKTIDNQQTQSVSMTHVSRTP